MSDMIEVRLNAIRYAARNTNLYEFRQPNGAPLPAAHAGAHIDLHLPNGLIRQYSLTKQDPDPEKYTLGIKHDLNSRGGSKYIFEELRVGQLIKISQPRNNFPLVEDAEHVVLIAGGIGITPLRAMATRLRELGRSFELHYTCRSRLDTAFLDECENQADVILHFDDEADGGLIDLSSIVARAPAGAHFYCCGPTPMLGAFEAASGNRPADHIHVEYFTAKNDANLDGGFTVELAKTGREFIIPPGKNILQVLREAGLELPSSCEQGVCGTCETTVLSGLPDHRDSILTQSERAANKTIMICCSGSKSERLVLDL